jgi:hypothetical protein
MGANQNSSQELGLYPKLNPTPLFSNSTRGGAIVSWSSCKYTILTRPTMKAELTILVTTTVEVDWLRELLMDLSIVEKPLPTILMNCDHQIVIAKVDNSKDNMKSPRHIKRRLKYVKKMRNSRGYYIGLYPY